jgi:two-component system chemotaxis response regulator CheB
VARPASPSWAGAGRVELVAVGASTGGPQALAEILAALPATCPVPVVVVQHVLSGFSGYLAERLAAQLAVGVCEAAAGDRLYPGQVWIAPGDQHLEVARAAEGGLRLRLQHGPPENSCRPSVDVLFRSAAQACGAGTLAVVLTGMGRDGLRGAECVRAAGGQVLAQDEATSVVWGMPGFVVRAGLADQVLPLGQLGPEVLRRVRRGRAPSAVS